jgi:hypothetical protein
MEDIARRWDHWVQLKNIGGKENGEKSERFECA